MPVIIRHSPRTHVQDGATALGIAANKGYAHIVAALLKAGADANRVRKDGATPLVASIGAAMQVRAYTKIMFTLPLVASIGAAMQVRSYTTLL